jgi:hypothetical protein
MATHTCLDCDSPGDGNCSVCHGKGKILVGQIPGEFGVFGHESSCSACSGSGHCQTCGGTGETDVGGEGD